jgi:hypothetical protein
MAKVDLLAQFDDLESWRAAVDKGFRSRRMQRFIGNSKG